MNEQEHQLISQASDIISQVLKNLSQIKKEHPKLKANMNSNGKLLLKVNRKLRNISQVKISPKQALKINDLQIQIAKHDLQDAQYGLTKNQDYLSYIENLHLQVTNKDGVSINVNRNTLENVDITLFMNEQNIRTKQQRLQTLKNRRKYLQNYEQ